MYTQAPTFFFLFCPLKYLPIFFPCWFSWTAQSL